MTTRTSERIALALAACIVLALYGAIIENWVCGMQADAATETPAINAVAL